MQITRSDIRSTVALLRILRINNGASVVLTELSHVENSSRQGDGFLILRDPEAITQLYHTPANAAML